MKRYLFSTTCVIGAAMPLLGQESVVIANANRFSLGARAGMNFTANFRDRTQSNPGPPLRGMNHNYDNGYVRVDSSGVASGGTWNWGYQSPSQVSGDTITFRSDQYSTVPLETEEDSDTHPGLEFTYQRVIGKFFLKGRWGLEAAVGYTDIEIEDDRSVNGFVTHVTDAYSLGGVIPPSAPYNGSFDGPGPVLNDLPTRTTPTEAAFRRLHQELTGYAVGVRVGPFFEWTFAKRFAVTLSGGLVLSATKLDYDFSETTTVGAGAPVTEREDSDTTDLLYGNYVAGTLHYNVWRGWGIFAGAQFVTLNELEQTVAGRTATLEQDSTLYGVAGVSFTF